MEEILNNEVDFENELAELEKRLFEVRKETNRIKLSQTHDSITKIPLFKPKLQLQNWTKQSNLEDQQSSRKKQQSRRTRSISTTRTSRLREELQAKRKQEESKIWQVKKIKQRPSLESKKQQIKKTQDQQSEEPKKQQIKKDDDCQAFLDSIVPRQKQFATEFFAEKKKQKDDHTKVTQLQQQIRDQQEQQEKLQTQLREERNKELKNDPNELQAHKLATLKLSDKAERLREEIRSTHDEISNVSNCSSVKNLVKDLTMQKTGLKKQCGEYKTLCRQLAYELERLREESTTLSWEISEQMIPSETLKESYEREINILRLKLAELNQKAKLQDRFLGPTDTRDALKPFNLEIGKISNLSRKSFATEISDRSDARGWSPDS